MHTTRTHHPHALARLLALLASFALMVFTFATTASATTDVSSDAGWQAFKTEGGVGGASVDGPYLFQSTKMTKVTVTDAYCHGDQFTVFDNGVRIGDTSEVPLELRTCPTRFYLSDIARADVSMADPTFGHGVFYVGPGSHSLEFVNKAIWNGTDSGSVAFFRLETASLSKADCMTSGWKSFGTLFTNQGQCVALSNTLRQLTAANVGPVTFAASPFGTVARGLTAPESWHKWIGPFAHATTYDTRRTVPITQKDAREVLTVTVPVSLSGAGAGDPAVVTATMTMTPQDQFFSWVPTGQYGVLGNTAWELIGDPAISDPSMVTTWSFRSTGPLTRGVDYDPIVISFDIGDNSTFNNVVYSFGRPETARVSATATGYLTGTGSGWYLPQP
ncbi:MAG: hypothetical protein Q4P07_10195 [Ornithinimicrobium sp.]|uniref:hypothetical protein n=1 Tax=Ornithinimicrobium sp. TaxID=1977084 RepID=UPI0026E11342|nr:hypothetical protein [Ornithinimicrobium sp.]MDO5740505.1 hypothetical protein [Ornithinimicrobium sp.]